MTDYDAKLTPADLEGLPTDLPFEVRDGDLVISGIVHGHGSHARVILQLLKTPPPPDDGTRKPAIAPGDTQAAVDMLMRRSGRTEARTDALIGEIVRFLVHADKAAFATIYGVVKTELAAQDERHRLMLREFRDNSREPPPAQ